MRNRTFRPVPEGERKQAQTYWSVCSCSLVVRMAASVRSSKSITSSPECSSMAEALRSENRPDHRTPGKLHLSSEMAFLAWVGALVSVKALL